MQVIFLWIKLKDLTGTCPESEVHDTLQQLKRAALIVERRGPDTGPYFTVTDVGKSAHQHVTDGVQLLADGEPETK